MRTRIKICGITRREDALAAAALGVDAIGLVFFARSPRAVSLAQALEVVRDLPPFVSKVALFVNATDEEVRAVVEGLQPDLLQFHGDETAAFCRHFRRPYIKAVAMRPEVDVKAVAAAYVDAGALLLDTPSDRLYGGSGRHFDWAQVPGDVSLPMILAGGLTADNVAAAIRTVRPYGVDVSSGVEATKGVKAAAKMQAFVDAVRAVDCNGG